MNEQSTDTVPTQAADTSANTGEVHAASDSAVSEGEAAKEQSVGTVPTQAADVPAKPGELHAARDSAIPTDRRLCGCLSWGCASRRRVGDRASSSGQR